MLLRDTSHEGSEFSVMLTLEPIADVDGATLITKSAVIRADAPVAPIVVVKVPAVIGTPEMSPEAGYTLSPAGKFEAENRKGSKSPVIW
jgi:hypothetical protein